MSVKFEILLMAGFVFMASPAVNAATEEEIHLEGVMHDGNHPENSVAVLNGKLLKKGEAYSHYHIAQIEPGSVKLTDDQTGKERILEPQAGLWTAPNLSSSKTPDGSSKATDSGMAQKLKELWAIPGTLVNRFWELKGLRDLATLNNACVGYYNKQKIFPSSFGQLIAANYLAKSYGNGIRDKYKFYFISPLNPEQFGIHADPLDPDSGLTYFYVGIDAIIRESKGKPANPSSPPHDY